MVNELQTTVTLSHIQFKALMLTGGGVVGGIEQAFGEIRLPPGIGPRAAVDQIAAEMSAVAEGLMASTSEPKPLEKPTRSAPKASKKKS
jgi:hypothetical protein